MQLQCSRHATTRFPVSSAHLPRCTITQTLCTNIDKIHARSKKQTYVQTGKLITKAGFPSNATHIRKYVTNAMNARKVRNKRSWQNDCSNNYPQPAPLLGRLLLQFNTAQVTEWVNKKTNVQLFNVHYKRRSVKGAVACLIGRCVRSASCVHCVTSVTCVALNGNRA